MSQLHACRPGSTYIGISADERRRERALRSHFAKFWADAVDEPRAIYDRFITASPTIDGVKFEAVETSLAKGWWVWPQDADNGTAVLFLHGGGYVQGSAAAYRGFVSQIVARAKIPALVVDYPLAPEASLPSAPDAALKAWSFLIEEGFDRIVIVGDSAGGGLALVTLASVIRRAKGPAPVAGVVFSPWTDLAFSGASMTDRRVVDPLIDDDYLRDCARKYCGDIDPRDPMASPLYGDMRGLPPLLIQVGTDERLLDDSQQYAERAMQACVPVQLEIWEGMHHVFQLDVAHLESSRSALDRAARFIRGAIPSPRSGG